MTLDIVIPALNEHENLKKLLPFLRRYSNEQTTNIIIVDVQKSKDNTEKLSMDWNCIYQKSEFSSRAAQLNQGAKISEAEVIMFLHADVFPPSTFLADIENCLNGKKDCGMFSYKFDNPRGLLKINQYFTKFDSDFAGGGDQCFFIRKSTFNENSGFDENYILMEDFEFFKRLKRKKVAYQIVNSPATVSARKYHKNSWLRVNLVNFLTFRKFKNSCPPDELSRFYKKWLNS